MDPSKMEMVQYWKKNAAVQAKLMVKDGVTVMKMEGEKYLFPGFPRGHLLFGKLSKLKHEIKNQIFNESYALIEENKPIMAHYRETLPRIYALLDDQKYDIVPVTKLSPPVKEIHRAWSKVSGNSRMRDVLCHIMQEDDSYRWRLQWLAGYYNPNAWYFFGDPIKLFEKALSMLEHGEIIGDMKGRERLLKRVLMELLKDEEMKKKFLAFVKEVDWKKIRLTKADKYFFRGKWFKVDLDLFEY